MYKSSKVNELNLALPDGKGGGKEQVVSGLGGGWTGDGTGEEGGRFWQHQHVPGSCPYFSPLFPLDLHQQNGWCRLEKSHWGSLK